MPVNRLRQPKKVREKLSDAAAGKVRSNRSKTAEATRTVDGKHLVSLIPVVRRRGRPSLASKFNPTVDINEALRGVGKGFFTGEEKDLFKTPLKGRPAEGQKQRQSAAGLDNSPMWSNKRGARGMGSSSHGSPGSEASSSDSPYFLRSKGTVNAVSDEAALHPKRTRKSVGLGSAEKKSPTRKERKSLQSPPQKKAKAEKSPVPIKAARRSSSGRKVGSEESSIVDKQTVERATKDAVKHTAFVRMATKSQGETKTSRDQNLEEFSNVAEKAVQVETGKKRKREQDELDDLRTKRAKVVIVDSAKIREMAKEPNQKLTSKLVILRASDEDFSDETVLKNESGRVSCVPAEGRNREQEGRGIQASVGREISKTKQKLSTAQVAIIVTGNQATPSRTHASAFKSVGSSASVGRVHSSSGDASGDLDETARKKLHNLTANISARSSWSAHLYDKSDVSLSKVPRLSLAASSQPKTSDVLKPPSAVTPSVDFLVNWDTSAVKDQLLSSLRPRKTRADESTSVPNLIVAQEAVSPPSGKKSLEESEVLLTDVLATPNRRPGINKPVFGGGFLEFGKSVPLAESADVLTNSLSTPLIRPCIDKPVFDRDVLEFGESVPFSLSRKTACAEKETETRRRSSSSRLNAIIPFNPQLQQLRANDASLRRSVDRLVPSVGRANVVRGRSVEPGMIRTETAIPRQPKSNGQLAVQQQKPVDEMRVERGGRICRRLLCLVGIPMLVIGCCYVLHLALAAGYLGEHF